MLVLASISELDRILDLYEKGKPFFLYTGRGPSSDSLHLGHMLPFVFTASVVCYWNARSVHALYESNARFIFCFLQQLATRRL